MLQGTCSELVLSTHRKSSKSLGNIACAYFINQINLHLCSTTLKVKDPNKYPVDKKPAEVNVYAGGPRSKAPAQNVLGRAQSGQLTEVGSQPQIPPFPMGFPYGFYPPPPISFPGWPGYLPAVPSAPNPTWPPANHIVKLNYPKIGAWLNYCDQHPDRRGENFAMHAPSFDAQGYRSINQLTRDRISIENLSAWLGIGKGTADLLIGYAEEDIELLKAGKFTMALANE
jgi:hypothetical protein